ncbi:MAG: RNA chaperone Hfq [Gammaproteobacteria bacterium]
MAKGYSPGTLSNALRKEKSLVSIYLVNGIKPQGFPPSHSINSLPLKNSVNQMIYTCDFDCCARNVRIWLTAIMRTKTVPSEPFRRMRLLSC